jgi:3-hydroxyisobutyrate dehydrogenase-like beta-hydroxyacid dehydrogenase
VKPPAVSGTLGSSQEVVMTTTTRIGFAGLGLMGSRMARRLLDQGFPLTVWNRTPDRCGPLVKAGAKQAASPRELAEAADCVVTCVSDPAAVERVVFAEDGVLAAARTGSRYLETSTISAGLGTRVAEAFRSRGGDALLAPVTGSKNGAQNGTLLFMTGGRRDTHDQLLPVMLAMGSKAVYCGGLEQAAVMKLIGNALISFMLQGLAEGIVVARKAGLELDTLLEVVQSSGYASPYFGFKGQAIGARDFDTHFSIDLLVKDQTLMLAEAAARRVPLPGLAAIREVFQAARAQGFGGEDIAAVVKVIERSAGV